MKSLSTVQLPVARFLCEILSRKDKELVIWVKEFAEALAYYNPAMNDFAAELIADVENFRAKDAERKRPRKTQSTTATQESSKNSPDTRGGSASPAESAAGKRTPRTAEGSAARSLPPSTAELYDFAEAARLSEADAREWWELCTERGWKDRSGNPIRDWKKACERYCARRAINRMAKGET